MVRAVAHGIREPGENGGEDAPRQLGGGVGGVVAGHRGAVEQQVALRVRHRPTADGLRDVGQPGPCGLAVVVRRLDATGISFAEQSMRRGRYPGQPKFPFVPGYDLVGTVVAVGADVDRPVIGTRVAAATKTGGWASYA